MKSLLITDNNYKFNEFDGKNIRAWLFIDIGMIVRNLIDKDEFIEIFVNTPREICQKRDPKELYKKSLNLEIILSNC